MSATVLLGLALGVGAPALKEKDRPAVLAGEWVIAESTVIRGASSYVPYDG